MIRSTYVFPENPPQGWSDNRATPNPDRMTDIFKYLNGIRIRTRVVNFCQKLYSSIFIRKTRTRTRQKTS